MSRSLFALALTFFLIANHHASANDWAHWRGPTGNGVAPDAKPPTRWSETENVKWKVEIPGEGSGSPVIWGDRVFVVTAVPQGQAGGNEGAGRDRPQAATQARQDQRRPGQGRGGRRGRGGGEQAIPVHQFMVLCFNREDGDLLWKQVATEAKPHEGTHSTNGFASASPCTDGTHVYAHFGSRGLYCYTMEGELVWERDFGKMRTRATFGEGSSPTLVGDKLIVPWDHEEQSYVYALDKKTGKILWQTERDEPTCWATPLIVEHNGKQQIVMNGERSARAYDLETGKELWRCAGQTARPAASPVAFNGLVFVGSGFRGNYLGAFRLGGKGDIEGTDSVVWSTDRDTPDIASLLLSEGRLYFHKEKSGILTCVDAMSGKPHYARQRIPGIRTTYASPIAAGGYVFLTGRSGTTVVIDDADQLNIVATNSVGEGVDATPAPAGNELFIRGEKHLFCIAE